MKTVGGYAVRPVKASKSSNLLLCCLAVWPLFWNLWGVLKVTAQYWQVPMICLWGITILTFVCHGRFRLSYPFLWFLFLGIVLAESISNPKVVVYDLSVIFCGAVFCVLMKECQVNYDRVLSCLVMCGFIISVSVILDTTLEIFKEYLIKIYTSESKSVKLTMERSGGLLPHTGSAGGYIYTGAAAYIAHTVIRRKNIKSMRSLLAIAILGLSALMIGKRGFILDTAVGFLFLKVIRLRRKDLLAVNVKQQIRRLASVVIAVLVCFVLYFSVSLVRESVDAMWARFQSEDGTYSGRTDLYAYAFTLYRGHYLKGIGWGQYRKNTTGFFGVANASYAVHNVYIQLLCETGILGLGTFLAAALTSLFYAVKKYRKLLLSEGQPTAKAVLELGIFMQVFFLTYCMSGNCLYDYNFCITYFIGILLTVISVPNGGKKRNAYRHSDILRRL